MADAGGARLIKDDKKLIVTKKLKESEVSMLVILAIIGVAALAVYFVLLPMFTNMRSLTGEIDELKMKELEFKTQIAQTEIYQNQFDEAQASYYRFFPYFFPPMDPEIVDERVTSMLIAHDMTPATLNMTTLEVEGISPYYADELRANPVPEILEPEEEAPELTAPPAGGADDMLADQGGTAAEPEGPADSYAFVYTVTLSAYGDRDNLYTFLQQVSGMTAMHVISFSFTDSQTTRDEAGVSTTTPGLINMQIKMYVLIDGVPARDFGAGGQ